MKQHDQIKYYNNLKHILKERQKWLDYFKEQETMTQLQKKANWRLFVKIPISYLLRFFLYLPVNILKSFKKASNKFYLSKFENEVEVLKSEIDKMNNN